jgi:hypothetical protein
MMTKSADISLRAQMLTLSYCTNVSIEFIVKVIDYSISQMYRIRRIAKKREFDSLFSLQILNKYTRHEEKSERSIKTTKEKEEEVIQLILKNRYAREKFIYEIAHQADLSRTTI